MIEEFHSNQQIKKILVIGPQNLDGFTSKIKFEIIKVKGKFFITKEPWFAIACRRQLIKILKHEQYDLIHTHFSILARDFGIPLVATFHTTHYGLAKAGYGRQMALWVGRLFHFLYDLFDRITFKHADGIVFVSQNNKALTLARHPHLSGKSFYIPNSVDTNRFFPLPNEHRDKIKSRYGLDLFAFNVLFVGRLEYMKGFSYLIEACKQIPGITLMIAGDGYLAKEFANYRFIRHLKYVPNERMNEVYNMADVYVLPSLYENCPSTILEAMACCLPIISTPVGDVINILP
ncbi:MAG: glycosyltransferase family 4 protein, partial [Dehalococcoidia bacterium]